ncbi:hypothetical protein ABZX92_34565 [Lentzea sp. NPDC006480]|uniref:hypothetical protein n=1 Tax=Lentzea sp. NPDC006480 TaxID=3157176 RepID=UPI0033B87B8E
MADALPGMDHLTEALRTTAAGAGKSAVLRETRELADVVHGIPPGDPEAVRRFLELPRG